VLPVSIARNFVIPLRHGLGLDRAETQARMEQALAEAELFDEVKDRLHRNALELSGGQQQRLCLARALALEPAILLLDEPTASLDFRAEAKIEQLLLRLKQRYTIVAVSHGLAQTCRLADRCAVLQDGRLCRILDGDQLRDEGRLRRALDEVL
jgi:phosphate transport system ATP-binding protein